ncbi:MAG TPA: TadE family protein [Bryobacteraceae bacterium]|nr:TadE family protein [Bryobacteraceae bacterium]
MNIVRNVPRRERGHAMLELALLLPWVFFLFAGAFDLGFYNYALISTQNAARVAAWYTSQTKTTATDAATACTYALAELQALPNVGTSVKNCNASPVVVTATQVTGADGAEASSVSVSYTSPKLIPIPGALAGRFTFDRIVQMRLVTQ